MYKTILIAMISIAVCSCGQETKKNDKNEMASIKKKCQPFPRKYKGFYAGMTVDSLTEILRREHFIIDSRTYDYTAEEGPMIKAWRDKLKVTAWIYGSKVTGIRFWAKKDVDFYNDVAEISRIYDGRTHLDGTGEAYYCDDLQTNVRPHIANCLLSFYDYSLMEAAYEDKNSLREKELKRLREKYE